MNYDDANWSERASLYMQDAQRHIAIAGQLLMASEQPRQKILPAGVLAPHDLIAKAQVFAILGQAFMTGGLLAQQKSTDGEIPDAKSELGTDNREAESAQEVEIPRQD